MVVEGRTELLVVGCIGSSAEGRLSRKSSCVEGLPELEEVTLRPEAEEITLRPEPEDATLRLGDDEGIPYLSVGSEFDVT